MNLKKHEQTGLFVSDCGRIFDGDLELKQYAKKCKFTEPYLKVNFGKQLFVHKLIAETWKDNPNGFQQVDHINRNCQDNRIENLRWVSKGQNQKNRSESAYRGRVLNSPVAQIQMILYLHFEQRKTLSEIAELLPIKERAVSMILTGNRWWGIVRQTKYKHMIEKRPEKSNPMQGQLFS